MAKQNSGIVIYDDNVVIVCNWQSDCPNGGLPCVDPFGVAVLTLNAAEIELIAVRETDDVASELPDQCDVAYDYNDDISQLLDEQSRGDPTPGTVYSVICAGETATVIAPNSWD